MRASSPTNARLVGHVLEHVHDHDPVELAVRERQRGRVDEVHVRLDQLADRGDGLVGEVRRGPVPAAPGAAAG